MDHNIFCESNRNFHHTGKIVDVELKVECIGQKLRGQNHQNNRVALQNQTENYAVKFALMTSDPSKFLKLIKIATK